jgi:hypothetical protein
LDGLAKDVFRRSEVENVVYPNNLTINIFTTAAVDNIDHNPSSTTARGSFHGTGISLHQHPDFAMLDNLLPAFTVPENEHNSHVFDLLESYTYVPSVTLLRDEPDIPKVNSLCRGSMSNKLTIAADECVWLAIAWQHWESETFTADTVSSWSAFHAQRINGPPAVLSLLGMLPLFHEQAHSVSMIRHSMDVVHAAIAKLNPGQVPVIAFDQPLYTLAKLIQWNWQEFYGENKFVIMFEGLHIEIAALKSLGSLLEGSGWVEALTNSGIITPGSAEALLSASHVRRCRRMHEVTLVSMHILQHIAFAKTKCDDDSNVSFDVWCEQQSRKHYQFAYWATVKQLQMTVLQFVRSIRESNFSLYVDALTDLIPWFFALDRPNYARWVSVHVRDMCELSTTLPDVFQQFNLGKFTVHRSVRAFSGMAIDHAHEQLNAVVKGDGGVIGLTENDDALARWIVSGPDVARLLAEFECSMGTVAGLHL